ARQRGLPPAGGYPARPVAGSGALLRDGRTPDAARARGFRPGGGESEAGGRTPPRVARPEPAGRERSAARPDGRRRGAAIAGGAVRAEGSGRRAAVLRRPERRGNRGSPEDLAGDRDAGLEVREELAAARAVPEGNGERLTRDSSPAVFAPPVDG